MEADMETGPLQPDPWVQPDSLIMVKRPQRRRPAGADTRRITTAWQWQKCPRCRRFEVPASGKGEHAFRCRRARKASIDNKTTPSYVSARTFGAPNDLSTSPCRSPNSTAFSAAWFMGCEDV